MAQARRSVGNAVRKSLKAVGDKLAGSKSGSYDELVALMDEIVDAQFASSPQIATYFGEHKHDREVDQYSLEAVEASKLQAEEFLKRLTDKFPDSGREHRAKTWTVDQRVSLSVTKNELENKIKGFELKTHFLCVHTMSSPHVDWPTTLSKMKVNSVEALQILQERIAKIPAQLDQLCEFLKIGLEEGVTPPRVSVAKIPEAIKVMASATPTSYHKLINTAFDDLTEDAGDLREELLALVDEELLPAFLRFGEFLDTEYIPNLGESLVIAERCTNGEALYAHLVKEHTTTNMTPEEIHQIGLDEVERIMNTMKEIATSEGFETVEAYQEHLDNTFFFDTEEKLLNYYKSVAMNIAPKLPSIIGTLPRTPFGVKAVPAFYAPTAPPAYYDVPPADLSQAGFFSLNTYMPKTRKAYMSHALVLHEGCPGHHLQIALATENTNLPRLRKISFHTAYIEGWGLYCEHLGYELDMYTKPEQHYGRLVGEMLRACRLVVDTGMNGTFGWSKEKAMEYMLENKAGTPGDIDSETTRYVAIPGQALSYKIGEFKLRELRSKCESELGDKFPIRGFHDLVLGVGSVPLDTLEEIVEDWISEQK